MISTKEKFPRKDDDQAYTTKFKKFRNKKKFDSRKKPNQEKDMSKIQCFNCRKYDHYKNHCLELKKRKETHEATIVEEKEPSIKVKQDEADFFF
jgi:phage terminase small subunit